MSGVSIGIDPSLTSTGWAVCQEGKLVAYGCIPSKGRKGASYEDYSDRFFKIGGKLTDAIWDATGGAELQEECLVVYEGPSYGSVSSRFHQLAGLWWALFDVAEAFTTLGRPVVVPTPGQRSKYITGSGRASKGEVMEAAERMYGRVFETDDEADAVGLAAMGSRHLGWPIEIVDLSDKQEEAFQAVFG